MAVKTMETVVADLMARCDASGLLPWEMCTRDDARAADMPKNPVTHASYRGANWFILSMYGVRYCAGRGQWTTAGATISETARGVDILAPSKFIVKTDDATGRKYRFPIRFKVVTVYPDTEVTGWTRPTSTTADVPAVEAAEMIVKGMPNPPMVSHSETADTGSYAPSLDMVTMPNRDRCKSSAHYYKTLLHELAHSTGHESRLNRKLRGPVEEYSREELVAEFTAAMLCASCGLYDDVANNSAAYIQHWKRFILSDPQTFVSACSDAQKAADAIRPKVSDTATVETADATA